MQAAANSKDPPVSRWLAECHNVDLGFVHFNRRAKHHMWQADGGPDVVNTEHYPTSLHE